MRKEDRRPYGFWKREADRIDWANQSNDELARKYGVEKSLISRIRHVHRCARKDPWMDVDWSKGTNQIAKEMKAFPAFVSYKRKIYAPETLRSKSTQQQWRDRLKNVDWKNRTDADISAEFGVSPKTINKLRVIYGRPRQSRYERVDWSRRTIDIAEDLGVSESSIAQARHRYAPDTVKQKG